MSSQKGLYNRKRPVGPCDLQAEQHRHEYTDDSHENTCDEVLLGNHLVVLTENVLGDVGFFMVML
jgi:hypothetical protein